MKSLFDKSASFTDKANISRALMLALLAIYMGYFVWKHTMVGTDVVLRIVFSLLPLLILLPGLIMRKYRTASMLCFILLLYFMIGVQSLFNPGNAIAESFSMAILVMLFTVAMFYSRWQQRADAWEYNQAKSSETEDNTET